MVLVDIIKLKTCLLKSSAPLGNVTAKMHFLSVCSIKGLLPNGFHLKFSLQTGLPEDAAGDFNDLVNGILLDDSIKLLDSVLRAENAKSEHLKLVSVKKNFLRPVGGRQSLVGS